MKADAYLESHTEIMGWYFNRFLIHLKLIDAKVSRYPPARVWIS